MYYHVATEVPALPRLQVGRWRRRRASTCLRRCRRRCWGSMCRTVCRWATRPRDQRGPDAHAAESGGAGAVPFTPVEPAESLRDADVVRLRSRGPMKCSFRRIQALSLRTVVLCFAACGLAVDNATRPVARCESLSRKRQRASPLLRREKRLSSHHSAPWRPPLSQTNASSLPLPPGDARHGAAIVSGCSGQSETGKTRLAFISNNPYEFWTFAEAGTQEGGEGLRRRGRVQEAAEGERRGAAADHRGPAHQGHPGPSPSAPMTRRTSVDFFRKQGRQPRCRS